MSNENVGSGPQSPTPPNEPVTPTYGMKAVGFSFNPSNNPEVDQCKRLFANCIDQMNNLRTTSESPEVKRMCSVAITEAQTAQMWATKALTWKD